MNTTDNPIAKNISIARCTTFASSYFGVLFLFYLLIFVSAFPQKELVLAVCAEVILFIALIVWRWSRSKTIGGKVKNMLLAEFASNSPRVAVVVKTYQRLVLTGWLIACLAVTSEVASLSAAALGYFNVSQWLYTKIPVSVAVGLHAACSLEMLSGAYVKAGKFSQAEPLYGVIKNIRSQFYGSDHELMVALHSDYGDLYSKEKQYVKAEHSYFESIELAKKIKSPGGYGRPLTGLANCYRDTGSFSKSEQFYKQAIEMRQQIYGLHSQKVADSLKEYESLLSQEGSSELALSVSKRRSEIETNLKKSSPSTIDYWPALFSILSLIVSNILFGRKGLITVKATRHVQAKAESGLATSSEIINLILLYHYQGETERALHWSKPKAV